MTSISSIDELNQIICSNHGNPHNILGMHEIKHKKNDAIVIRAFIPQADSITVVDAENKKNTYEMVKIHIDGFFEILIDSRNKYFDYYFKITGFDSNEWISYDPYSFLPQISDLDKFLFAKGTHYEIFDKLGAHPKIVAGVSGTSFAVWAPAARRVSVIGDFNSWDGRRHPMRVLPECGIWELFIPGVTQLDKYKFELKLHNNALIEKTDPFGNFQEHRPSTTSLVYDINNYKWNDSQWIKSRNNINPLDGPINIYEVHLGSWKKPSDPNREFLSYKELGNDLIPYVVDMGYTHIELMPIEEHPFDGSWGYQVVGYYSATSRYGTPTELMEFIDTCHNNNIGVILDWVPAHFPKDTHGLAKFDGTALFEHADPKQGEHPDWGTLIFNFGRNEVQNFLISNALFWIEKYHIDGLRVDAVASMLYLDYGKNDGQWIPNEYGGRENLEAVQFMKHMNSIILGKHPNVLMCAEESTSWGGVTKSANDDGLGFNLKWNMGWMNDFLSYIEQDPIYRQYHHGELTFSMIYAYTENFILVLSHDEVVHGKGSLVNKMPGDLWQKFANVRLVQGFMCGHPGKLLNFMGNEIAQFEEWSETKSINWYLLEFDHHKQMQTYSKDLNNLYKSEPAFWKYDFNPIGFEWIDCNDSSRSTISFIRKTDNALETLVVLCNFTPTVYNDYYLKMPYEGTYVEIFNSDDLKYGGSGVINEKPIKAVDNEYDKNVCLVKCPPLGISIFKLK